MLRIVPIHLVLNQRRRAQLRVMLLTDPTPEADPSYTQPRCLCARTGTELDDLPVAALLTSRMRHEIRLETLDLDPELCIPSLALDLTTEDGAVLATLQLRAEDLPNHPKLAQIHVQVDLEWHPASDVRLGDVMDTDALLAIEHHVMLTAMEDSPPRAPSTRHASARTP